MVFFFDDQCGLTCGPMCCIIRSSCFCLLWDTTLCGLRGCNNNACSISWLEEVQKGLPNQGLVFFVLAVAGYSVCFLFQVYVVFYLIVFGCQYQCNRLHGKTRLWNDLLCVDWDVKPYILTHLQQNTCRWPKQVHKYIETNWLSQEEWQKMIASLIEIWKLGFYFWYCKPIWKQSMVDGYPGCMKQVYSLKVHPGLFTFTDRCIGNFTTKLQWKESKI